MESETNKSNPSHSRLVRLWMMTHYAGRQAIVFFNPFDHFEAINKKFGVPFDNLFHCDIYIIDTDDPCAISVVNDLEEDEFGYVMLWDGANFVTENT